MTDPTIVVGCAKCQQCLRVDPSDLTATVRCPRCGVSHLLARLVSMLHAIPVQPIERPQDPADGTSGGLAEVKLEASSELGAMGRAAHARVPTVTFTIGNTTLAGIEKRLAPFLPITRERAPAFTRDRTANDISRGFRGTPVVLHETPVILHARPVACP